MRATSWFELDWDDRPGQPMAAPTCDYGHGGPTDWPTTCWPMPARLDAPNAPAALAWLPLGGQGLHSTPLHAALTAVLPACDRVRWFDVDLTLSTGQVERYFLLHVDKEPGFLAPGESRWMFQHVCSTPVLVASTLVGRDLVFPEFCVSPVCSPRIRKIYDDFGVSLFRWERVKVIHPDDPDAYLNAPKPFIPFAIPIVPFTVPLGPKK